MLKVSGIVLTLIFSLNVFAEGTNAVLSDAQIAKVLVTINEGEIDASKMAANKTKNEDVKGFAKMMIEDHEKNREQTKAWTKKAKMSDKDSNLSTMLKNENKAHAKELKGAANFDKAYMEKMVAGHEKVLKTLHDELIPAAKDAELKTHLQDTEKAVAAHLEHAKQVQAKL